MNHSDLIFTIRGLYSYQDFKLWNAASGRVGDIFRVRILHPCGTKLGAGVEWTWGKCRSRKRLCHTTSTTSPRPILFSPSSLPPHYALSWRSGVTLICKAMALCASCREFDIHKFNAKNKNTQCFELTLVAIAASEGCPFCKFIYDNKPSHNSTWEMSNLWIHYKMLTPADVEYDILPSGPGLRFTQLQVWVGSKKALAGWGKIKYFRLISEPGV